MEMNWEKIWQPLMQELTVKFIDLLKEKLKKVDKEYKLNPIDQFKGIQAILQSVFIHSIIHSIDFHGFQPEIAKREIREFSSEISEKLYQSLSEALFFVYTNKNNPDSLANPATPAGATLH